MKSINFNPLYLSLYLAFISSFFLIIIGIPFSFFLSRMKNVYLKRFIETFVALPLVLPPTVLGFYILILINPFSNLGKLWFYFFGYNLAFSMSGLILGSILYSLPFAVQPIQIAFEKIERDVLDQAYVLQFSRIKTFFFILIPIIKNSIITSFILSFSHTLGEFGVVLMIGGNIPGKTQVVSIAIYESIELLDYKSAHILSFIILLISFLILFLFFNINKKK